MDNGKNNGLTQQEKGVRVIIENLLDLLDANWRDELTNPDVNHTVEDVIEYVETGKIKL